MPDIYFWRQLFILCTGLFSSLTIGFMLAFPSVLNPAITEQNGTDISTTGDHASWITAIHGVGGLVGCFIIAPIMDIMGRKACHISMNAFWLIGWVIFPLARDIHALYAARFIQGISAGGIYLDTFTISEYVHPSRRGYYITLKKLFTALGVLFCHALSSLTWRQIAILSGIQPLAAIVLALFWPESPSHLALKGKFEECERSFKWLNGSSQESHKHLKALTESRRQKLIKKTGNYTLVDLFKKFLKKDFQKAFIISTVLTLAIDISGRYYYMAYIMQIMNELMDSNTSALYFTLGSDSLTLLAVSTSTIFIKYVNRRTVLFSTGIFSVILMLLISVCSYLKTVYSFPTALLWFTAVIIILQSFIVNIGLVPVSFAIISEIFPLEHKGFGSFVSCFIFTAFYAVVLKLVPILVEHTKLYGTYGIFGVLLGICLIVSFKTVPETKDKTLQDIEDELNDVQKEVFVMEIINS